MTALRNLFCCLVLLAAAQWLAVRVEAQLSAGASVQNKDPLYQLIGSAKEIVGDSMLLKAESYFHGGAKRDYSWEDEEDRARQGHIEDGHEHEIEAGDWPAQINSRVKSHEHYHLKESEQKEILPFLFLAVQLDPYHVEAQLSTAFWLEKRMKKPAEALEVLLSARRHNPDSWEIAFEIGNLYWRAHHYDKALPYYEDAQAKLDPSAAGGPQAAHLQYYLAHSYENTGDTIRAREHYENFLKLLPPGQNLPIRRQVTQKLESLV